jgi:hypothetical protein
LIKRFGFARKEKGYKSKGVVGRIGGTNESFFQAAAELWERDDNPNEVVVRILPFRLSTSLFFIKIFFS